MELPRGQSAFLWGPRKTGKTMYLAESFPASRRYDLLQTDLYLRLLKEPHRLREEVCAMDERDLLQPIIIDEVQKVPALLDEVHWLIENRGTSFILCGSSARKLRRTGANLLGGRAWGYRMFPLTSREVPDLDLLRALDRGLIPSHYLSPDPARALKAYVYDYINEEVRAEGLARNIPAFSRLLDAMAFSNGEMVNFANTARDCGVDAKTVREYYQILADTMLGELVPPYAKRVGRDIITAAPKFYCFDTGLANTLSDQRLGSLKGERAGKLFENFILMEMLAYGAYSGRDFPVRYWRTKTGLEVDFILGDSAAVEVKIASRVDSTDLRGLRAFSEEHPSMGAWVVSQEPRARRAALGPGRHVDILPWRVFLDRLWSGKVVPS